MEPLVVTTSACVAASTGHASVRFRTRSDTVGAMRHAALPAVALAAFVLAGSSCAGSGEEAAAPNVTAAVDPNVLEAAREEAFEHGRATCETSSIADFALARGYAGRTVSAVAAEWARTWDSHLRDAAYRGCRQSLAETVARLGETAWDVVPAPPPRAGAALPASPPPGRSVEERQVYVAEYEACAGLTPAQISSGYGIDTGGKSRAEVVLEMERQTYRSDLQQVASEACLHAMNGQPARYR